ncbi:tetratricopeptide repeat protein [Nitratifractor sp.]|uniref:tetratricopeptide repeat protein n=1 Tax=Nitratifractor sp. TaxID=2268144 RepID=UPI0025D6F19C|nr:tetratricopeptide repeat protein [Nitratifractor sp.]
MKPILLSLLGGGLLWAASAAGSAQEDRLIVEAIFQDEHHRFDQAETLFVKLYHLTGRSEYLVQAAKEAMLPGGDPAKVIPLLKAWISRHEAQSRDTGPVRMLVALYAKSGRLDLAEPLADKWLVHSDRPADLKLAATLKNDLGKYKEALELLKRAYAKAPDDRTLLQEVSLLEKRLNDRQEAIRLLETHLRLQPDASVAVYFKLIELYAKANRLDKVLELYKKLYEKDPQQYFLQKIVKLSLYTHDLNGLIALLEKHSRGNEALLYRLYKETKQYDKAIALAHRRYVETGKPKWLAEEAILTYEKANAQKKITPQVLKTFRRLFDKALKQGVDDSLYLNYYGYTLIEHDLDVERGIALVRRALKQQPDNIYYLDSLAWGLYKEGHCEQAYRVMEKVIAGGGNKEPEIKMHWESVRKCMEKDRAF